MDLVECSQVWAFLDQRNNVFLYGLFGGRKFEGYFGKHQNG